MTLGQGVRAILHCLPRHTTRELDQPVPTQDDSTTGCNLWRPHHHSYTCSEQGCAGSLCGCLQPGENPKDFNGRAVGLCHSGVPETSSHAPDLWHCGHAAAHVVPEGQVSREVVPPTQQSISSSADPTGSARATWGSTERSPKRLTEASGCQQVGTGVFQNVLFQDSLI